MTLAVVIGQVGPVNGGPLGSVYGDSKLSILSFNLPPPYHLTLSVPVSLHSPPVPAHQKQGPIPLRLVPKPGILSPYLPQCLPPLPQRQVILATEVGVRPVPVCWHCGDTVHFQNHCYAMEVWALFRMPNMPQVTPDQAGMYRILVSIPVPHFIPHFDGFRLYSELNSPKV